MTIKMKNVSKSTRSLASWLSVALGKDSAIDVGIRREKPRK